MFKQAIKKDYSRIELFFSDSLIHLNPFFRNMVVFHSFYMQIDGDDPPQKIKENNIQTISLKLYAESMWIISPIFLDFQSFPNLESLVKKYYPTKENQKP